MEKKSDESWKKIVFEKIKDQVNHLYVSNLGRIKSNSKLSGGKILSGSLKEGYPSLSLRFMAPRTPKNEKIIQKWREEIDAKKVQLDDLVAQKEKYKKGSRNFISITNEIKSAKKVNTDSTKNLRWFNKVFREDGGILINSGDISQTLPYDFELLSWKMSVDI